MNRFIVPFYKQKDWDILRTHHSTYRGRWNVQKVLSEVTFRRKCFWSSSLRKVSPWTLRIWNPYLLTWLRIQVHLNQAVIQISPRILNTRRRSYSTHHPLNDSRHHQSTKASQKTEPKPQCVRKHRFPWRLPDFGPERQLLKSHKMWNHWQELWPIQTEMRQLPILPFWNCPG